MEGANIKLAAVASDVLGVSGLAMLSAVLDSERDPHVLDLSEAHFEGRACVRCADEQSIKRPVGAWSEQSAQLFECVNARGLQRAAAGYVQRVDPVRHRALPSMARPLTPKTSLATAASLMLAPSTLKGLLDSLTCC